MTAITMVDNSEETFGDKVSIADLAHNSFGGADGTFNSHLDNPAEAAKLLRNDWKHELEKITRTKQVVTAKFKDGSKLIISALGICCSQDYCPRCKD